MTLQAFEYAQQNHLSRADCQEVKKIADRRKAEQREAGLAPVPKRASKRDVDAFLADREYERMKKEGGRPLRPWR